MTVGFLKRLIEEKGWQDTDRIILDSGELKATPGNEVICAYQASDALGNTFPVVVLQTRNDINVPVELENHLREYAEEGYDETDVLSDVFEEGFTLEDFGYSAVRQEWARHMAEEHGLI